MIKEGGKIIRCPKCGSKDVIRVPSFDYWKQCKKCKHEFMTEEHN